MSLQELQEKQKEKAQDLFNLRIRHSLNQVDNPLQLREARRDLARIKTVLAELRKDEEQGSKDRSKG
jgi:large subunit ribosomal protein L29